MVGVCTLYAVGTGSLTVLRRSDPFSHASSGSPVRGGSERAGEAERTRGADGAGGAERAGGAEKSERVGGADSNYAEGTASNPAGPQVMPPAAHAKQIAGPCAATGSQGVSSVAPRGHDGDVRGEGGIEELRSTDTLPPPDTTEALRACSQT